MPTIPKRRNLLRRGHLGPQHIVLKEQHQIEKSSIISEKNSKTQLQFIPMPELENAIITFSGRQFSQLFSSILYIWKRGDEILYIGVSVKGIARFTHHHIIGVVDKLHEDDTIEVRYLSPNDAINLERELVRDLKPKFNSRMGRSINYKEPSPEGHNEALDEIVKNIPSLRR